MIFYLGYLRYSYYSAQHNYAGQKKKVLPLWEFLMFWNTFDSVSGKSTDHFLLILSTGKKIKTKSAGVSQKKRVSRGSQKISVWMKA